MWQVNYISVDVLKKTQIKHHDLLFMATYVSSKSLKTCLEKRLVRIARWAERGKGNVRVSGESSFKLLFLKKKFEANILRLEKAGGGHITFIMFFSVFPWVWNISKQQLLGL